MRRGVRLWMVWQVLMVRGIGCRLCRDEVSEHVSQEYELRGSHPGGRKQRRKGNRWR